MLTYVSPHSFGAVVITRPRFESRRFLSLGTRVSSKLPLNDVEGSPVTGLLPAHSSIHSLRPFCFWLSHDAPALKAFLAFKFLFRVQPILAFGRGCFFRARLAFF